MKKYIYLGLGLAVVFLVTVIGLQSSKLKDLAFKLLKLKRDTELKDITSKCKKLDTERKAQSDKRRQAYATHNVTYESLMAKLRNR